MELSIASTPIDGMTIVSSSPFKDKRGTFYRAFCDRQFAPLLAGRAIRQINVSRTESVGAIRGLHFQLPPVTELKMVRCLRGRIWDVAVDLREKSKTFLHWYGVELGPDTPSMVIIPEGCAHGFQVLEKDSEVLYLHTAQYVAESERGLRYDDPLLAIAWPLVATDLSERDRAHPLLARNFGGISL